MTNILSFPAPDNPLTDSGPYEEDNRILTPEAMDEFDASVKTAVNALAA